MLGTQLLKCTERPDAAPKGRKLVLGTYWLTFMLRCFHGATEADELTSVCFAEELMPRVQDKLWEEGKRVGKPTELVFFRELKARVVFIT